MSTSPAAPPSSGASAPVSGQAAPAQAPAQPVTPAPNVQGAAQGSIGSSGNKMPNRGKKPTATSLPGLPPLLELVSNQAYSTEQHRTVSQFVPSAAHMFHIVHEMDEVMTMTDRFTRGNHSWVPVMTHYYVSIMWYFMVMTISAEAGILDQNTLQFLNVCQQLFDYRSLLIPGPLVPFFEAMATCSAHFNWYGDISPNLPTITELDMNVNARFHIAEQWLRLLPNPLFAYEGIRRFASYTTTIHDYATASAFQWYRGAFGTNTQAANNAVYIHFMAPNGIASVVPTTAVTVNAYQYWHSRLAHMFATQFTAANAVPVSSWAQFFGFVGSNNVDNFNVWNTTTPVMQTYCSFFHGSRALSSISPTGLGAIIPRGIVQNYTQARDYWYPDQDILRSFENRQFGRRFERSVTLVHRHADHTLPELAEQYAALTCVHLSIDSVMTQNQWAQIDRDQQRVGPFWNVINIRNSVPLQVWFGYGQMVSGRYHSSTSLAIN